MKNQNWRKVLTVHIIPSTVLEERMHNEQADLVLQRFEEMMESTLPSDEFVDMCIDEFKLIPPVLH